MKQNAHRFVILLFTHFGHSVSGENPSLGHWALTIPGGGPGWLMVHQAQITLTERHPVLNWFPTS